jgi:hypothetical protein
MSSIRHSVSAYCAPMLEISYWREKAAECLQLAKDSSDPSLAEWMTRLVTAYLAAAEAIDAKTSQEK